MKTYEVLEKALDLIRDEANWCASGSDGWRWTDADDHPVCAEGALQQVLGLSLESEERGTHIGETPAYEALLALTLPRSVYQFNDNNNHAEVVALFQEAIRREKEREGIPVEVPTETPQEVAA